MSPQQSSKEEKYPSIAYLLWGLGFVGICGLHRMYLGQYGLGTAMLFTFGLCGIGQLVDVAVIPQAVRETNGKDKKQVDAKPVNNVAESVTSKSSTNSVEDDDFELEQASIEETMKKLRD